MYDVTVAESFKAVKPWLINVQVRPTGETSDLLCVSSQAITFHHSDSDLVIALYPWWSSQWDTCPLSSRKQQGKESPSSSWETKWTWTKTDRCPSKMLSNWLTWVELLFYLQWASRHPRPTPYVADTLWTPCVGKQHHVLRGQRLHRQECDRVPDSYGQVGLRIEGLQIRWMCEEWKARLAHAVSLSLCVFAQSVNGTGRRSDRPDHHPQCAARQTESLLQVKYALTLLDTGVAKSETILGPLP